MDERLSLQRGNLLLSLLAVIVTVVMTSVSTYAWFVTAQSGVVSNMKITADIDAAVSFSTGSTHSGKIFWTTSGFSTLTQDDIENAYDGNVNHVPENIVSPVSSAGRLVSVADITRLALYETTFNYGASDEILSVMSHLTSTDGGNNCYMFDLFAKSDYVDTICIKSGAIVFTKGADTVKGDLSNAVRVAFLNLGTVSSFEAAKNLAVTPSTETVIWEPNALSHNSDSQASNNTYVSTYAINAENSTGFVVDDTTDASLLGLVPGKTDNVKLVFSTSEVLGDLPLTTVQKGITKIRIYVWIEGQDVDCSVSGAGGKITLNLVVGISDVERSKEKHTVSLRTADGCEQMGAPNLSEIYVEANSSVNALPSLAAAATGFSFDGWYLDKECNLSASGHLVTENVTLYAKFV